MKVVRKNIIRIEELIDEIEILSKKDSNLNLPVGGLLIEIGIDMLQRAVGSTVAYECIVDLIDSRQVIVEINESTRLH